MSDLRPKGRAARFADGIRRRVAVRARVPGRVEQVLCAPWRPRRTAARRQLLPAPAPTTIQIGLRVDVHAAARRAELRREPRVVTRRERAVVPEVHMLAPTVPAVLARPAGASARPGAAAPAPSTSVGSGARAGSPAGTAPPRPVDGPRSVPQVHRRSAPSLAQPPTPADAATSPPAVTLRWADDRGGHAAAHPSGRVAALTAADVPGVVDRVVRELDRRVTAARERKGWTG